MFANIKRQFGVLSSLLTHDDKKRVWLTNVIEQYQDYVFALALSWLKDEESAKDVTQEVFLAVCQGWRAFRGEAKVTTWLYRITLRVTAKHKVKMNRYVSYDLVCELTSESLSVGGIANDEENKVWQALDKLSLEERTILTLAAFEHLSNKDIAEILNIKVGTVGSRLYNARKKLSVLMG